MTYKCKVCGYPGMESPPDPLSYEICPCCACEYGLTDADRTHEELRATWIADGLLWWSLSGAPEGWDPVKQLIDAGFCWMLEE